MTAVASPPSYSNGLVRNGWAGPSSVTMSSDDVSRLFVPRRSAQRSNSSSSLSSQASSASSASASSTLSNGTAVAGDIGATRRKPPRAPWPASTKSEPVSGISSARSQTVNAAPSATSAASAISALHGPQGLSQHGINQGQTLQAGTIRTQASPPSENPPMLNLMPMNGTFERKTITAPYSPDVLRIGRQTNAKTVPTPLNGYFDSKVLSRQHAEIWAERDGEIWIRDVKSSNGTFVNGKRLSQENRDSEPHPLKGNDILELGIDIISEDQKTVVHHKVAARIEHAGPIGIQPVAQDLDYDALNHVRNRSSTNYARFGNNMSSAAYHAKWLQPVTVEQIAKRLQKELKQARLQAQDLNSTASFVDAVIANTNPPPPKQPKITSPSKSAEVKARFSMEPPVPPPSQPLPETPDVVRIERSSLRRSDTERPRVPFADASPTASDMPSVNSLVEALSSARSEINLQSEKLKELEDTLLKEREARAFAEERAGRLAAAGSAPNTPIDDSVSPSGDESDTSIRMQHRLELLQAEMEQVRVQMEGFRQRAETAEQENASSQKTLAEMVEAIQKRDEQGFRKIRDKNRRKPNGADKGIFAISSSTSDPAKDKNGIIDDGLEKFDEDLFEDELDAVLQKHLIGGGGLSSDQGLPSESSTNVASHTLYSKEQVKDAVADVARLLREKKQFSATAPCQRSWLEQGAPYASMLSVVLLGVGVMAYLNGWKPVER